MLDGRVIVITNARHFVGPSTADVLARYGATVICHDGESGPGIIAAESTEPEALVEEVVAAHDRIDTLICNDAYPALRAPVDEAEPGEMGRTLEALVEWPYRLIGCAVPHMKAAKTGRIIMVTSAAPLRGLANYSMYATARGAGNALVKSLSLELAPFNIQVNAIAPNYIENPTYFPPELLANKKAMAKMLSNIPAKRLGKPEEVAETIAFFASDKCGFITGHVLPVAGGWA
jgi:NAD(P)-dependent dehydrogenase (short-subunit alcohol dehydrogenase family)